MSQDQVVNDSGKFKRTQLISSCKRFNVLMRQGLPHQRNPTRCCFRESKTLFATSSTRPISSFPPEVRRDRRADDGNGPDDAWGPEGNGGNFANPIACQLLRSYRLSLVRITVKRSNLAGRSLELISATYFKMATNTMVELRLSSDHPLSDGSYHGWRDGRDKFQGRHRFNPCLSMIGPSRPPPPFMAGCRRPSG